MLFENDKELAEAYPYMNQYTNFMKKMTRELVGREFEMQQVQAAMLKPEYCNVLLLAEAGAGKTALVQGIMVKDLKRTYLEVDLSKMIANLKNENEMADRLKTLFDEVSRYRREKDREIVLFIDEFHQIVQLSPAAVEVLKPLLADSGTRGIRVVAATTHVEYQQYIAPNLPLVERLQRIKLVQPGEDVVVAILKNMCDRYQVTISKETLFHSIYEYTNRYLPAMSQPRKSILILDSMIGWHRLTGKPLDVKLLADVIYETEGINVAFRVDPTTIRQKLDEKVLAQQVATTSIEQRLQLCVAGLNNPNRPMSSFLFTGSTGVGKRLSDDVMVPVWTPGGSAHHKRNGDLVPGDYVFNRKGEPVRVLETFHYDDCPMLEVELADGRTILADPEHLWQYKSRYGNGAKSWKVANTQALKDKMAKKYYNRGRSAANMKFVIPMNGAVQWPERKYSLHPYVMGAALGNGCLTLREFTISSNDEDCIGRCRDLISGANTYKRQKDNYSWHFYSDTAVSERMSGMLLTKDVLSEVPEIIGKRSDERFIPDIYKHGSAEQRRELIRGLLDTDGTIDGSAGRYNVSYSTASEQLAKDMQQVLYSLGISSSVSCHKRSRKPDEYDVHVKIGNGDKKDLFWLPRKRAIAEKAALSDTNKRRVKKFGEVIGIRDIRETGVKCKATCIRVDDPEHLYQAGDFIVTHNTETTKQLAMILYDDDRNLIRFDMTEYALEHSLDRFRKELTNKVSTIPYCIILLDEIEKAAPSVTRVLLQVLDDGRLMDENEREVTFKNAYIIITTNAGNEVYKTMSNYDQSDRPDFKTVEKYDKLIRESIISQGGNKFPPELLGRIDCIVPFQPLSKNTMRGIIEMKLRGLAKNVYQKHGVKIHVSKDVYLYLIYDKLDADSDAGGARIVVSKMERELTVPLARFINEHPEQKEIYISVAGQMAIMDKRRLESEAYILVSDHYIKSENTITPEMLKQLTDGGNMNI